MTGCASSVRTKKPVATTSGPEDAGFCLAGKKETKTRKAEF